MELTTDQVTINPTISFGQAVKSFYAKYFDFKSRSRRSEYWWAMLYEDIILFFIFGIFLLSPFLGVLLFFLGIFLIVIPDLAVTVRRLHDVNHSGWLVLLVFIPLIGSLIIAGFCLKDSSKRENQWGVSPKYLHSKTFDDNDSDNDLSAWSYIWPLLLYFAMVIFIYVAGALAFLSALSSLSGNDWEEYDFEKEWNEVIGNDSTLMIDEMDSTAILTDSTDFELLPDSPQVISNE